METTRVDSAPEHRAGEETACAQPRDVFIIGAHSILEMNAMEFIGGSHEDLARDEEAIIDAFAITALDSAPSTIGRFLPAGDFIPDFDSISGSSVADTSSQPVETADCSVATLGDSPRTTRLTATPKWAVTLTRFLDVWLQKLNTLTQQLRKGITSPTNYVNQ
jgi:hypothetical protein